MKNAPLNILLADDDDNDRFLFKEALGELKVRTTVNMVNDGTELMAYLHEVKNPLPHLLFLDLNMPRMNGIECLKEIRKDARLKEISVAIYSTSASEMDIEETFRNGANVYIKKPNEYAVLRQVLEKAVMTTFQYQEPPFNKDNFMLRM